MKRKLYYLLGFFLCIIIILCINPVLSYPNGKGLYFDGIDDYVRCSNNTIFDLGNLTFEGYIKTESAELLTIHSRAFDNVTYKIHWTWEIIGDSRELAFEYGAGVITSSNNVPLNEWVYVATTFSNVTGETKFYFDGSLDSIKNYSSSIYYPVTQYLHIGCEWFPMTPEAWNVFKGTIDYLRIWNRVLSDEEISSAYNGNILNRNGLILSFYLNEGIGEYIYDYVSDESGLLKPNYPSNSPQWVDWDYIILPNIYITQDKALSFQLQDNLTQFLTLTVTNNILDASLNTLIMQNDEGEFHFTSNENSTIRINHNMDYVRIEGHNSTSEKIQVGDNDYFYINEDDHVIMVFRIKGYEISGVVTQIAFFIISVGGLIVTPPMSDILTKHKNDKMEQVFIWVLGWLFFGILFISWLYSW